MREAHCRHDETPLKERPGDGLDVEEQQAVPSSSQQSWVHQFHSLELAMLKLDWLSWSSAASDEQKHSNAVLTSLVVVIRSLERIALASPRIQRSCVHHVVPADRTSSGQDEAT